MSDDPRLESLLDELLDSHTTPEQVCDSCPDLLPEVRRRWQQMNRVQAELDLLFPPATETLPPPTSRTRPSPNGRAGRSLPLDPAGGQGHGEHERDPLPSVRTYHPVLAATIPNSAVRRTRSATLAPRISFLIVPPYC
jgi:hypothetical protein